VKLASFEIANAPTYGIVTESGVVDLGKRIGDRFPDLKALLGANVRDVVAPFAATSPDAPLDAVQWRPVIPNPGKIFCIGHNYEEHRLETQREKTAYPSVFVRFPESLTGHARPLLCPRESTSFDYEGEIALVIGKPGRRIAESDAWNHVAGYACFNEGSVRDWQKHTGQFTPGKNFVETGAFGPWMVTADELPPGTVMSLTTRLRCSTSRRRFRNACCMARRSCGVRAVLDSRTSSALPSATRSAVTSLKATPTASGAAE